MNCQMKKILVIDDNQDILEMIRLLLELEGYDVKGLDNGHQLMEEVDTYHPDLIIMDVMLGDMDGRLLCNTLKHTRNTETIPVIMISASHNLKQLLSKFCEPDDFLAKPFDINRLIDKVGIQLAG